MVTYKTEVISELDETSGIECQPLEMNFKFMDSGREYECDIKGEAFLKTTEIAGDYFTPTDSEVEVEVLLNSYYLYYNGFNEPLFNTDITEEDLEEVLIDYCT